MEQICISICHTMTDQQSSSCSTHNYVTSTATSTSSSSSASTSASASADRSCAGASGAGASRSVGCDSGGTVGAGAGSGGFGSSVGSSGGEGGDSSGGAVGHVGNVGNDGSSVGDIGGGSSFAGRAGDSREVFGVPTSQEEIGGTTSEQARRGYSVHASHGATRKQPTMPYQHQLKRVEYPPFQSLQGNEQYIPSQHAQYFGARPSFPRNMSNSMSTAEREFQNDFYKKLGNVSIEDESKLNDYSRRFFHQIIPDWKEYQAKTNDVTAREVFESRRTELIDIAVSLKKDMRYLTDLVKFIKTSSKRKMNRAQSQTTAENIAKIIYSEDEIKSYLSTSQVTAPPRQQNTANTKYQDVKSSLKRHVPPFEIPHPTGQLTSGRSLGIDTDIIPQVTNNKANSKPKAQSRRVKLPGRGSNAIRRPGSRPAQTKDDDDDKDLLDIAGVDEDNEEKDLLSQQALLQQALDNSDVDKTVFSDEEMMHYLERLVPAYLGSNCSADNTVSRTLTLALEEYLLNLLHSAHKKARRSMQVCLPNRPVLPHLLCDQPTSSQANEATNQQPIFVRSKVIQARHIQALCIRQLPHSRSRLMHRYLAGLGGRHRPIHVAKSQI
eukprot:gene8189-10141_t